MQIKDFFCESNLMDYIKSKNPSTPIKAYLKGDIDVKNDISEDIDYLELKDGVILFGDYSDVAEVIQKKDIKFVKIECERTNSKLETVGYENINARIEPGAEIREGATIGENAVIMMGGHHKYRRKYRTGYHGRYECGGRLQSKYRRKSPRWSRRSYFRCSRTTKCRAMLHWK